MCKIIQYLNTPAMKFGFASLLVKQAAVKLIHHIVQWRFCFTSALIAFITVLQSMQSKLIG